MKIFRGKSKMKASRETKHFRLHPQITVIKCSVAPPAHTFGVLFYKTP